MLLFRSIMENQKRRMRKDSYPSAKSIDDSELIFYQETIEFQTKHHNAKCTLHLEDSFPKNRRPPLLSEEYTDYVVFDGHEQWDEKIHGRYEFGYMIIYSENFEDSDPMLTLGKIYTYPDLIIIEQKQGFCFSKQALNAPFCLPQTGYDYRFLIKYNASYSFYSNGEHYGVSNRIQLIKQLHIDSEIRCSSTLATLDSYYRLHGQPISVPCNPTFYSKKEVYYNHGKIERLDDVDAPTSVQTDAKGNFDLFVWLNENCETHRNDDKPSEISLSGGRINRIYWKINGKQSRIGGKPSPVK